MQHFKAYLHDEAGTTALGAALARTLAPGLAIAARIQAMARGLA